MSEMSIYMGTLSVCIMLFIAVFFADNTFWHKKSRAEALLNSRVRDVGDAVLRALCSANYQ